MSELEISFNTVFSKALNIKGKENYEAARQYNSLKSDIELTKVELHNAITNFNNVTDPKLIDMYIYQIQSTQTRYEHLLSLIKEL